MRYKFGNTVVILLLAAFMIRFVSMFYLETYKEPRTWEFGQIADNIVKGNGFKWSEYGRIPVQSTSIQAPFYPYLLAFFIKYVPLPFILLQILQIIFSVFAGLFLFYSGKEMFNRRIGIITLFIYSFHPVFVFIPSQYLPLAFYMFHFGLGIYLFEKIRREQKSLYLVIFGINSGIVLLWDPIISVFLAAVLIYWIVLFFREKYLLGKVFLTAFGITVLIVFPWMYRNYQVHNQFVFIKSNVGYNIWRGNHFGASGTGRMRDESNIDKTMPETLREKLNLPEFQREIARDNLFKKEGIDFIKSHPIYSLKLALRKAYYFWWFDPTHPKAKNLIYRISYSISLFLGLAGLIVLKKSWRLYAVYILHFLLLTVVYSFTIVLPRYHMQIDFVLLIFMSYVLDRIYHLSPSTWKMP